MKVEGLELYQVVKYSGEEHVVTAITNSEMAYIQNELGNVGQIPVSALEYPERTLYFSIPLKIVQVGSMYHVTSPLVNVFHTMGQSKEKTIEEAKKAIEGFFKAMIDHYSTIYPAEKKETKPKKVKK